jgi:hypothetical protein
VRGHMSIPPRFIVQERWSPTARGFTYCVWDAQNSEWASHETHPHRERAEEQAGQLNREGRPRRSRATQLEMPR